MEQHETHVSLNSGGTIRLAVIPKSVGLDYWEKVHRGAECAASQQRGVDVVWNGVTDETDVAGQIDLLQNYIGQGVNGLVYAATDSTALTDVSNTATAAGIKVLNIDSGTDPQPKDVPLVRDQRPERDGPGVVGSPEGAVARVDDPGRRPDGAVSARGGPAG